MTIPHGGFAVLTTAWIILVFCALGAVLLIKKKGRR